MFFGGIQKNSFIDYPGKISCVLFFSGCNFHCPYCHNPDLANGKISENQCMESREVFDFLSRQKGFLEGVAISGGEPTLYPELCDICRQIHDLDYPIKLDTNGSHPDVVQNLLDKDMIDYIAMDIKTDPQMYSCISKNDIDPDKIVSSVNIIKNSKIPYEFRTTCVKPLIDSDTIGSIAEIIKSAELYALQRFRNNNVLEPDFFKNNSQIIDESEIMGFKQKAEKYVKRCIVR